MSFPEIKTLLDDAVKRYNHVNFIADDPVQIPHRFTRKEDIEIAAFLSATIAWGQRKSIIKNGLRLMELLDNSPYDFLMDNDFLSEKENEIRYFVHRTFNGYDCLFFLKSLQNIYRNQGGLEQVFKDGFQREGTVFGALTYFRNKFLETPHENRSRKHLSDVQANSSAKRLNMFLRWMVRSDENGVDFGLWKNIPMSALMLPLDVHTGNVSRNLGLLNRKQNDWRAVEEITEILRTFDADDPIKYDYALFGLGVEPPKSPAGGLLKTNKKKYNLKLISAKY